MVLSDKGVSLCVEDVFAKKFLAPAGGALASVLRNTLVKRRTRSRPRARVAESDAAIERINRELPNGAKRIDSAELVARQLGNFVDGPSDIPRITWHMRLPAFQYAGLRPYTWPRQS